jgi:hypothetical protein
MQPLEEVIPHLLTPPRWDEKIFRPNGEGSEDKKKRWRGGGRKPSATPPLHNSFLSFAAWGEKRYRKEIRKCKSYVGSSSWLSLC